MTRPQSARTPARRDGHLDDLDLELVHAEPAEHASLRSHLDACEVCTARLHALEKDAAAYALPASIGSAPTLPQPANSTGRASWFLGLSAVAAVAVMAVMGARAMTSITVPDEFRPKGSDIRLQVFVHDGDAVHTTASGGTVHPGDRLGFRVTPRQDGFLYVIGFDAEDAYPCWPQDTGSPAQHVDATGTAMDLNTAIELDARLGTERIVAVLCDAPANFNTVVSTASGSTTEAQCILDEVLLEKVAP